MGSPEQLQCIDFGAACRRKLPRPQKSPRRQRILADLLRRLRQPHLPAKIFRIKLRDPLPAKKRVFVRVPRS